MPQFILPVFLVRPTHIIWKRVPKKWPTPMRAHSGPRAAARRGILLGEVARWYYGHVTAAENLAEGENMTTPGSPMATPNETRIEHSPEVETALASKLSGGRYRKYGRFVLAALGSIPWVGGAISAIASFSAEKDQEGINDLQKLWLEAHKQKIAELADTFIDIFTRLENFGDEIQERIESPPYLALVQEAFRSWDQADTQEKKQMLKKLITNAGAIKLCQDDLVRLFIHWISQYHETHFLVIKEVYRTPQLTRGQIWDRIRDQRPRENSAEADLFRYLIRDLTLGGVIRQERETTADGQFLKKDARGRSPQLPSRVMESAFEGTKLYELTELGKQFVHYVMDDVVPQIDGGNGQ
jgi:hypothetical protein